jgi:hypothetical protein
MPGHDGTGPMGIGPMTGRGVGNCQKNNQQKTYGCGYGLGKGNRCGKQNAGQGFMGKRNTINQKTENGAV